MALMHHPDLDARITAAPSQVPIFEKSGWQVVDDLTDLTKSELVAEAEQRGIPINKSARKAEIAEAIESNEPEGG